VFQLVVGGVVRSVASAS